MTISEDIRTAAEACDSTAAAAREAAAGLSPYWASGFLKLAESLDARGRELRGSEHGHLRLVVTAR